MNHPTTHAGIAVTALAVLALAGCAVTAPPTAATTPDLSLPVSSPIAPWPGPDAPVTASTTDTAAPAATTDPGTAATSDPGAGAPAATAAAPKTTKAAAPRTTTAAAPRTTQAAPPPAPKTTAAPAKPWIKLTSCTYDAATGKTLGKFSYYSPSASTTYQITINGFTFPAVPAGVGTGVASAKYAGPGTSCSATIG